MAKEGRMICKKCGAEKPIMDFYKNHKYRMSICKDCYKQRSSEYLKTHPEGNREKVFRAKKKKQIATLNEFLINLDNE